jgi:sterol 14-demethylase
MSEAPEIFKVDAKGKLTVLQDTPDNALLKKAQRAAKYCPTSAIKIIQK